MDSIKMFREGLLSFTLIICVNTCGSNLPGENQLDVVDAVENPRDWAAKYSSIKYYVEHTLKPQHSSLKDYVEHTLKPQHSSIKYYVEHTLEPQYSSVQYYVTQYLKDSDCSDFYRSYIPYVEKHYMNSANFDNKFWTRNHNFATSIFAFETCKSRQAYVNRILERFDLEIEDRGTCSFKIRSNDTIPPPPTIAQTSTQGSKKKGGSTTASDNMDPNKCEKFIVFFDALLQSTNLKNTDLRRWKFWVKNWPKTNQLPFPFLVQRILSSLFWAHKFHHGNRGDSKLLYNASIAAQGRLQASMFYECLSYFRGVAVAFNTPDTMTPASVQYISDFPYPPTEAKSEELSFIDEEEIARKVYRETDFLDQLKQQ